MGSFKAELVLDGGEPVDILAAEYEFSRDTDAKGKVASDVYGGRVNITIESTEKTAVLEAMLNNRAKKIDAKITFFKSQEDAKMKTLEIKEAYIVYYKEFLDTRGDVPMNINFTLSAKELVMGEAKIVNSWPSGS